MHACAVLATKHICMYSVQNRLTCLSLVGYKSLFPHLQKSVENIPWRYPFWTSNSTCLRDFAMTKTSESSLSSPSPVLHLIMYQSAYPPVFPSENISWSPPVKPALGKALSIRRGGGETRYLPHEGSHPIEETGVTQLLRDTNNEL